MRKPLLIGLLSAGLLGAMLPGVAVADPGSVMNTGQCVEQDYIDRAAQYSYIDFGLEATRPGVINANGVQKAQGGAFATDVALVCSLPSGAEPA